MNYEKNQKFPQQSLYRKSCGNGKDTGNITTLRKRNRFQISKNLGSTKHPFNQKW